MAEMISMHGLVEMGKTTLEWMRDSVVGAGVFSPVLLREYSDETVEVTLIMGDPRDDEHLGPALELAAQKPLYALALTTNSWVAGDDRGTIDALIVLHVTGEGASATVTPYDLVRSAHKVEITWRDTESMEPDPKLAEALYLAVRSSHERLDV